MGGDRYVEICLVVAYGLLLASENQGGLVVEEVLQVHVFPTCGLRPETTDRLSPLPPTPESLLQPPPLEYVWLPLNRREHNTHCRWCQ